HSIHAQPDGVVTIEPAKRATQQKSTKLVATVVEDRAAPVGMHAKPGIRVLEEVGAVEVLEAKLVGGKVGGDPVEDDPDSVLVQIVDEEHEVLRRSVAARRREVTGDLVAPR